MTNILYGDETELPEIHSAVLVENQTEYDLSSVNVGRCQVPSPEVSNASPMIGSIEISGTALSNDSEIPEEFYSALEAVNMSHDNWDMRPHLLDQRSGEHLLLDSGAAVSCCPPDPGDAVDPSIALKAVNGSRLKCFGRKRVEIKLGRKTYPIDMLKTEVKKPILGWDFTRKHRLTQDWTEFGDAVLIDKKNGIQRILKYKAVAKSQVRPVAVLEPVRKYKTPQQIVFEVSSMEALAKETESVIN